MPPLFTATLHYMISIILPCLCFVFMVVSCPRPTNVVEIIRAYIFTIEKTEGFVLIESDKDMRGNGRGSICRMWNVSKGHITPLEDGARDLEFKSKPYLSLIHIILHVCHQHFGFLLFGS